MNREKVIETIKALPQEFDLDMLIEKLVFAEKVQQGLAQIQDEKTISHEHVRELVKGW